MKKHNVIVLAGREVVTNLLMLLPWSVTQKLILQAVKRDLEALLAYDAAPRRIEDGQIEEVNNICLLQQICDKVCVQ